MKDSTIEKASKLNYYSNPGAMSITLRIFDAQVIQSRPHLILLELESNNLTKADVCPSSLARDILNISKSMVQSVTKFVLVSIHRKITKSAMNIETYNARVEFYYQ